MKRKYGLTPIQRVERRRTITKTGCWECDLAPNKPYALIKVDGRHVTVHRLVWEHYNGPIPPDICVCHKCDNPRCHNPDHLFLGTYQDNVDDMMKKQRYRGGNKPTVDYKAVCKYAQSGEYSQKEIGEHFGLTQSAISRILRQAGISRGKSTTFRKVRHGENHPRAKLTKQDVLDIRTSTASTKTLATKYNVAESTIIAAKLGYNWKE
jgi:hypothetical protein